MADSGAIIVMVEDAVENIGANGMEFAEEGRQARSAFMGSFGRNAINFAAVAGG
jgi:hypothetical protein